MSRILGIDPGFAEVGWGIIEISGNRFVHIAHGFIKTFPSFTAGERLNSIFSEICDIIDRYNPGYAGIEDIFFSRNKKSALPVAQAKGVLLLALERKNIVTEAFTPLQIKQALTGNGRAEKEQVKEMVKLILGLSKEIKPSHAADALAAAICFQNNNTLRSIVQ